MERILTADDRLKGFIDTLRSAQTAVDQHEEARVAAVPIGVCARCEGSGWVSVGPERRMTRCRQCAQTEIATPADGVPYEFQSIRLDGYDERPGQGAAITKARAFVEKPDRDLYLTGGVGAGKTRLACAIANDLYRQRKQATFARVPMLLYQLQPGRDAEEIAALERKLFTTPFVVLDDIGAERDQATDFTRRTLLMIYEERCDRGLRTIFTSNKSLQQLSDMQDDDRLSSRIAGRCDVIRMTTDDQRLRRVK